jgi:hypothetical protein
MTATLNVECDRLRLTHLTSVYPNPRLSVDEVAELSNRTIVKMTSEELACVIRSVRGVHLRSDVEESLELYGQPTLRRLVFLTRRMCCQQLAAAARARAEQDWSGDWALALVD